MTNPNVSGPRTQTIRVLAPAVTILATGRTPAAPVEFAGLLSSATYLPVAAVTGAASPASRTITIVNRGQTGVGTTVMATLAYLAGINGVAFDEMAMTLSAVAGALAVVAGDVIAVHSDPVGGTGLVDPGGEVVLQFSRVLDAGLQTSNTRVVQP
jgi:hypothetical protein